MQFFFLIIKMRKQKQEMEMLTNSPFKVFGHKLLPFYKGYEKVKNKQDHKFYLC